MKGTITRILTVMLSMLLFVNAANAAVTPAKSYKGTTKTHIMGKDEVMNDLVLTAATSGSVVKVKLTGYAVLDKKNVSITADVTLDEKGNIKKADNIVIKGAPGKIKSVEGTMTDKAANITLKGKAILVGFTIVYSAKAQ